MINNTAVTSFIQHSIGFVCHLTTKPITDKGTKEIQ